jgi:osmoprotectant transport system substrate-binding protein
MRARRILATLVAVGSVLAVAACGDDSSSSSSTGTDTTPSTSPTTASTTTSSDTATPTTSAGGTVRLSGQNFPEATLVADMYEQVLENAGYTVDTKLVDTRAVYLPLFPSQVDIVPEYVGSIINTLNISQNGDNAPPFEQGDGAEMATAGKAILDKAGITLLDTSSAADANAFMVTKDYSDENGVTKLSDLKGKSVVLAAASDCQGRIECAGGLTDTYGIDITKILPLGYASDQTYQSVISGESQLGETSTTDGTLDSQGLLVLDDDQHIQPAQNLVPAVSTTFLAAHPDVADVLNPLMAALTTDNLTDLNAEISVNREKPEDVAKKFLEDQGLL